MSNGSQLVEAISDIGDSIEVFKKSQDKRLAAMQDRIESIEAQGERPGAVAINGKRAQPEGFKVYPTAKGTVYELSSKTRMQDVLPPEREPEISLGRFLAAGVLGEKSNDQEALAYCREQKQLTTGTSGLVIPAQYQSQWIDLLRSQMVLNRAGLTTVTMDQKTQVHAALTADPAATWHSEGGSINAGNPTFAARTLSAQTIVARCQASVEVAQDSPAFGEQLAAAMTRAIAQEIDRVGLFGSGDAPEPQGIFGADGINTVTAVGTPSDYSDIIAGVRKLLEANVDMDPAVAFAIMSPRTWATYENLATGISSDNTPLPRPRSIADMQFLTSTAVSNTLETSSPGVDSAIFLGDFRDLALGIRREASVKVLETSTYASNLLLEFVAYARCDFVLTRPASFCVLEGVTSA